jgi:very-short-patch-repair endonuclease
MAREHHLQRLAARQHGLASRKQLLALGYTRRQIDVRIADGRWRFVAPRVVDVAPASRDDLRPLHAAVLDSGAVASHRSAAALHGLLDAAPKRPQVTVWSASTPRGLHADVHRTTSLPRGDRTVVGAIACTSVARTVMDLGAVCATPELALALNRAILGRKVTIKGLARRIETPRHGWRGVAPLRRALRPYLVDKARCESDLEALLLLAVGSGELPPPVWQHGVRVGGTRFRLDCAWPAQRVFIEGDGMGAHTARGAFEGDRRRQNLLVAAGWAPLRYTWTDVSRRPRHIVRQTASVLAARS